MSHAAPAQSTTLARFDPSRFSGTHTDPAKTTALLQEAQQSWNLVSPSPAIAQIPEGCAIALAAVFVDPKHDTYPIPGGSKLGIGKAGLDRIRGALGVKPVPNECGRIDDGSHPYYVRYRWVGYFHDFDGTKVPVVGEKIMDLRDGSAMTENLHRIARAKGKKGADSELAQMRAFILEHAETKARLRAIRSLGVKTSYEAAELAKPFVAARLQFTGDFKDPETKGYFQRKLTDNFLDASAAAFGSGQAGPTPTALPHAAPTRFLPPPPVEQSPDDDDDDGPQAASQRSGPEPRPAQHSQPATDQVRHAEGSDQVRMPGKKGGTVAEAEYDDLVYWRGKVAAGLEADPNGKYAANNRKQLAMIEAEIAARDDTTSADEAPEEPTATPPASATEQAPRAPRVPKGLPGAGKSLRECEIAELVSLRDELMKRLDAAERSNAGTPEQRAKAAAFLDQVTTQIDLRRAPPPASGPQESDDDFMRGLEGSAA
jgi:hypothetical protein